MKSHKLCFGNDGWTWTNHANVWANPLTHPLWHCHRKRSDCWHKLEAVMTSLLTQINFKGSNWCRSRCTFWNPLVVFDKQTSEYCCHSGEVQPGCCILQQMSLCVHLCDSWWKLLLTVHSFWYGNMLAILCTHQHVATIFFLLCFCTSKDTLIALVSVFLPPQSPLQPEFPVFWCCTSAQWGWDGKRRRHSGWSSWFWRLLRKCSFTA